MCERRWNHPHGSYDHQDSYDHQESEWRYPRREEESARARGRNEKVRGELGETS